MSEEITLDAMNPQPVEREAHIVQAHRAELVERISRAIRAEGKIEPLPSLHLQRAASPKERVHSVVNPTFCVIAQGSKEVFLGHERYQYDPYHYLLFTAELPVVSQIIEASPERPYLSIRLDLDPTLVGSVTVETGHSFPQNYADVRAINVSALDASLLEAMVRLTRLLDTPAEAPFLAPLITREIIYRLLRGEQSGRLHHIAALGGHTHRIARAIERLRKEFDQPLRIDDMAQELSMSVSSFHSHFKAVTAMSPLQFQKRLRLLEARQLMLGEQLDAANAGYRVGYDDDSYFNREYKSLFGLPPLRDVARLRAVVRQNGGLGVD